MITFEPKRTLESKIIGNNDTEQSLIYLPKAMCGFKIVDSPQDKSCTFFAITLDFKLVPTTTSTYICKLQSVTDILRDTKMKPLELSLLESQMVNELKELSRMLNADLKGNNILLDGDIDLNENPSLSKKNLKVEFDKYQPSF